MVLRLSVVFRGPEGLRMQLHHDTTIWMTCIQIALLGEFCSLKEKHFGARWHFVTHSTA